MAWIESGDCKLTPTHLESLMKWFRIDLTRKWPNIVKWSFSCRRSFNTGRSVSIQFRSIEINSILFSCNSIITFFFTMATESICYVLSMQGEFSLLQYFANISMRDRCGGNKDRFCGDNLPYQWLSIRFAKVFWAVVVFQLDQFRIQSFQMIRVRWSVVHEHLAKRRNSTPSRKMRATDGVYLLPNPSLGQLKRERERNAK